MRRLVAVLLVGCASSDGAAGGDAAVAVDAAAADAADAAPTERGECPTQMLEGRILTCAALTRCEAVPFEFQLACCSCDTRYCRPDPACEAPPDAFADDVLPRLDRLCKDCHAGTPNPADATLALYLSPAAPPAGLDAAQVAANREEVLSHVVPDDPAASPLLLRPAGEAHPVILTVGDADHAACLAWIEALPP